MNKESQMSKALNACTAIATDYTKEEVIKFMPKSVQHAWQIGDDYLEYLLKESKKNREDFTL